MSGQNIYFDYFCNRDDYTNEYIERIIYMGNTDEVKNHMYKPNEIVFHGKKLHLLMKFPAADGYREDTANKILKPLPGVETFTRRELFVACIDAYVDICVNHLFGTTDPYASYVFYGLFWDAEMKCHVMEFCPP